MGSAGARQHTRAGSAGNSSTFDNTGPRLIKYALAYLAALVCLVYGYAVGHFHIFPYQWLHTVYDEINYIKNDWTGGVERFLVAYEHDPDKAFSEVESGRFSKKTAPELRANDPMPGYRAFMGSFDFDPPAHAVVLLGPDQRVHHIWRLNEDAVPAEYEPREDANKFPHGMEILPDGSVIFAYDAGSSLQRFDACGDPLWTTPGAFHHSLSLDIDGEHVWVLLDASNTVPESADKASRRQLVRVGIDNGEIVKRISLRQVMDANPGIDILGLHQTDYEDHYEWQEDSFHENDIEPLPRELAGAFPQFEAGDLLLSLRALDLIFVLDPDTLKVKWWRIAQTRRQHDADWQPDGTITVYDNDMHRGEVRIVKFWPQSYEARVLYDGRAHEVKSWFRGRHQVLPNGNVLVTVPQQGRVLEVTPDDQIAFEFLNRYRPRPGYNLLLSEARWLPSDYFEFEEFTSCAH